MADTGVNLTDKRTRQLMKRLEGVYADALQTAILNNRKAIEKYAALTDEALKDLTPEQRQAKREYFANEIKRTKSLANKIAAEIANAGETAAHIIQSELSNMYGINYDFGVFSIQRQAGVHLEFSTFDRNQLAAITQEKQSPFTKIAYKNLGKDKVIVQRLQNHLIAATLNGESQQKIIQRIKGVTGQSTRQAKRVAQTERTRVQSQGRNMAIDEAVDMGLEMQKQWVARLVNTRELHIKTHLEIVEQGEKFSNGLEFPGDPNGEPANVINCHCFVRGIVKSKSPALEKHRAFARDMSFKQFTERTGTDINVAKSDIEHYKGRVSRHKGLLDRAIKREDKDAIVYHSKNLKTAQSRLSSSQAHLRQAKKNHEYAKERVKHER